MKLSVETKVAAAVAIAFAALSIGAIAQEQSEHGTAKVGQIRPSQSKVSLSVQNTNDDQLLAQY